ncbi:MAG: type II toxin-antitoxin system HicB family antitoxin [Planctomycetes bacterium]|nr:type II toxin-antitoxin system HicB family antitoxin [Planctomycetota bacterium]
MNFTVEIEQEEDGRWLAEVTELPGVLCYGQSRKEAADRVKALALRRVADELDHGESVPHMANVSSESA